jgi:hypothetical protein
MENTIKNRIIDRITVRNNKHITGRHPLSTEQNRLKEWEGRLIEEAGDLKQRAQTSLLQDAQQTLRADQLRHDQEYAEFFQAAFQHNCSRGITVQNNAMHGHWPSGLQNAQQVLLAREMALLARYQALMVRVNATPSPTEDALEALHADQLQYLKDYTAFCNDAANHNLGIKFKTETTQDCSKNTTVNQINAPQRQVAIINMEDENDIVANHEDENNHANHEQQIRDERARLEQERLWLKQEQAELYRQECLSMTTDYYDTVFQPRQAAWNARNQQFQKGKVAEGPQARRMSSGAQTNSAVHCQRPPNLHCAEPSQMSKMQLEKNRLAMEEDAYWQFRARRESMRAQIKKPIADVMRWRRDKIERQRLLDTHSIDGQQNKIEQEQARCNAIAEKQAKLLLVLNRHSFKITGQDRKDDAPTKKWQSYAMNGQQTWRQQNEVPNPENKENQENQKVRPMIATKTVRLLPKEVKPVVDVPVDTSLSLGLVESSVNKHNFVASNPISNERSTLSSRRSSELLTGANHFNSFAECLQQNSLPEQQHFQGDCNILGKQEKLMHPKVRLMDEASLEEKRKRLRQKAAQRKQQQAENVNEPNVIHDLAQPPQARQLSLLAQQGKSATQEKMYSALQKRRGKKQEKGGLQSTLRTDTSSTLNIAEHMQQSSRSLPECNNAMDSSPSQERGFAETKRNIPISWEQIEATAVINPILKLNIFHERSASPSIRPLLNAHDLSPLALPKAHGSLKIAHQHHGNAGSMPQKKVTYRNSVPHVPSQQLTHLVTIQSSAQRDSYASSITIDQAKRRRQRIRDKAKERRQASDADKSNVVDNLAKPLLLEVQGEQQKMFLARHRRRNDAHEYSEELREHNNIALPPREAFVLKIVPLNTVVVQLAQDALVREAQDALAREAQDAQARTIAHQQRALLCVDLLKIALIAALLVATLTLPLLGGVPSMVITIVTMTIMALETLFTVITSGLHGYKLTMQLSSQGESWGIGEKCLAVLGLLGQYAVIAAAGFFMLNFMFNLLPCSFPLNVIFMGVISVLNVMVLGVNQYVKPTVSSTKAI